MADRILKANDYTTFDLLAGVVEGHGFTEEAFAILNVTTDDRDNPEAVELQVEMDNTELDEVCPHADKLTLTADQAREMAGELEKYAGRVESATE
jgi:voltage-gated potassium channel Kch